MTAATKRIGWIWIAFALGACGEDIPQIPQGVWKTRPEQRWRLVETLRIGVRDGDHPAAFGDIRSILVDHMHRMWVVDQIATEVRVFTPDGRFVRALGGRGEGPGEFQRIGDAFHGPNGEIWVEDVGRRWEVFDTAGQWLGTHRLPFRQGNMTRAWTREGILVLRHAGRAKFFQMAGGVLQPTGRQDPWPSNPLAAPLPRPSVRFESEGPVPVVIEPGIPFAPHASTFLGPALTLGYWRADVYAPDRYEIRRTNLEDGPNMDVVIRQRHEPVLISDSVRKAAADSLLDRYTSGTSKLTSHFDWTMIPRHYPAFDRIFVATSGEVWVRRTLAGGVAGFDVFDKGGHYLGQPEVLVHLGSMRINVIAATDIYAIYTDSLGVDYVVRMDVRKGVGSP